LSILSARRDGRVPENFAGESPDRILGWPVGTKMWSNIQLSEAHLWVPIFLIEIALVTPAFSQSIDNGQATARASDSFLFTTENFRQYSPVSLGNGYLVAATPWNGTIPTSSTVVGLYDHLEQKDYSYQALIPSWNEVDYWNGSHWLNQQLPSDEFKAVAYRQSLNMFQGTLQTQYDWVDGDKITHIIVESFVARQVPWLGIVHFSFTPNFGVEAGPLTVSFPLGGPEAEPFIWEGMTLPGAIPIRKVGMSADHHGFWAVSKLRDGSAVVAEALQLEIPATLAPSQVSIGFISDLHRPSLNVKFIVKRGETYTFAKLVSVAAGTNEIEALRESKRGALIVSKQGYRNLLAAHQRAWETLWQSDILIEGDPEAQRVVHAALFYLISQVRPGSAPSLPAIGLPSRAYLGRVWWDADTWVFPSLLLLHPDLAESIVTYRERMLPGAVQNAKNHGYSGAKFPMESASTGLEEAPEWSSEIHEGGDVALAQWRYYLATGDLNWLRERGYPVIRAVADFWASRVHYNAQKDRYEILHLTGPNEAITDINNDAYTNAIARLTLNVAAQAALLLRNPPNPKWKQIASKLAIPFDESKQYHPEHECDLDGKYAHTAAMLAYPLALSMPEQVKRNDLEACMKNFMKPGYEVGMLGNFYSIVASELQRKDLAQELFLHMRSYAKPPFYAMSETPTNNRFVFLTAEGAFLQQVLFGFTGLRLDDSGLVQPFRPSLPQGWKALEIRNIKVRGKVFNVQVGKDDTISIIPAG
jgi:protein-glucosylgalactosylhydroxylysine glucosidase